LNMNFFMHSHKTNEFPICDNINPFNRIIINMLSQWKGSICNLIKLQEITEMFRLLENPTFMLGTRLTNRDISYFRIYIYCHSSIGENQFVFFLKDFFLFSIDSSFSASIHQFLLRKRRQAATSFLRSISILSFLIHWDFFENFSEFDDAYS